MASIYCLYSTEDGVPRYIGKAADRVSYRFKQHITAALEKETGALYDWMRDTWRLGYDVAFYALQDGVIPADEEMFERYWISQFANLLNIRANARPIEDSPVAKQVKAALRAQLDLARHTPQVPSDPDNAS